LHPANASPVVWQRCLSWDFGTEKNRLEWHYGRRFHGDRMASSETIQTLDPSDSFLLHLRLLFFLFSEAGTGDGGNP
jgi:hypothetical protein